MKNWRNRSLWKVLWCLLFFLIFPLYGDVLHDRIDSLLVQMTPGEKILQLHHEGGFNTSSNTRLGIPGWVMADGPHGVREGLATSFPVGIAQAATWDPGLIERMGQAMGEEFYAKGKNQALGPCIDLTRDPRNGRSPESGGEDPYLDAVITSALVRGIQKTPVIATLKHYNCVNHQDNRVNRRVVISKRNLMEHYGLNFRTGVQMGGALCVMNAYNLVNGEKCAENEILLDVILRKYWGFPFYVVSDWGSIWNTEKAIHAGCDICMGSDHYQNDLLRLLQDGTVSMAILDRVVRRVLWTKLFAGLLDQNPSPDPSRLDAADHRELCYLVGLKSLVLLKNEGHLLPIDKNRVQKIAVIGPNAKVMRTDGSGSSWVEPFYTITPYQGIASKIGEERILYAKGCDIDGQSTSGFADAENKAKQADIVIFFGGLAPDQEGEGFDRKGGSVQLPKVQQQLINRLAEANSHLVVVLQSGGICALRDCIQNIQGLLYAFYPGQEGGQAIADVLFGDANPGGKLPVTMPVSDEQLPAWNDNFDDDYGCGYRWFDEKGYVPQFAFGHGLSYTTFSFTNLKIEPQVAPLGQPITITVDVTNTGDREGDEVVQLYASELAPPVWMPKKQLKGFKRITLRSGETQTVTFTLTANELYYFDEATDMYRVDPGIRIVRLGGASDNLPLEGTFEWTSSLPKPDLRIGTIRTVPPFPQKGDSVVFTATVVNYGGSPTPVGVAHSLKFSLNGQEICSSLDFTDPIPPGGMALLMADHGQVKWCAESPGEYQLEAWVNPEAVIDEWIFDNNRKSISFTVRPIPPENLALHRPVQCSSVENASLACLKAVDGDYGTRWSSAFLDPQWIWVDLGKVQPISRIVLYWETAYGTDYQIQVSNDGSTWQTVFTVTGGDGGVDILEMNTQARYVRLFGIKRGTQWGYSLYEFEIYGPDTGAEVVSKNNSSLFLQDWVLYPAYPNPFNGITVIQYHVAQSGPVRLEIFDLLGKCVNVLKNQWQAEGDHKVVWKGENQKGEKVAGGIYFCRLVGGKKPLVQKLFLIK